MVDTFESSVYEVEREFAASWGGCRDDVYEWGDSWLGEGAIEHAAEAPDQIAHPSLQDARNPRPGGCLT